MAILPNPAPDSHPVPAEAKACTRCKAVKAADAFTRYKATGKLCSRCKECKCELSKEWQRANKELADARVRKWVEGNRERSRAIKTKYRRGNSEKVLAAQRLRYDQGGGREYFAAYREANRDSLREYKNAYNKDHAEERRLKAIAHYAANRDTIRARARELFAADPERYLLSRVRAAHLRRSREEDSVRTLTLDEWLEILRLQGNRCAACRKRFGPKRRPSKDHIVPVSKGGGLTLSNIQALCRGCNSSKRTKTADYRGLLPGFLD